jgi:hypothetical protein
VFVKINLCAEQPDFVVEMFEDGFEPYYLKTLKNWQLSLMAASVRRSSRTVVAPLKFWKGTLIKRWLLFFN